MSIKLAPLYDTANVSQYATIYAGGWQEQYCMKTMNKKPTRNTNTKIDCGICCYVRDLLYMNERPPHPETSSASKLKTLIRVSAKQRFLFFIPFKNIVHNEIGKLKVFLDVFQKLVMWIMIYIHGNKLQYVLQSILSYFCMLECTKSVKHTSPVQIQKANKIIFFIIAIFIKS